MKRYLYGVFSVIIFIIIYKIAVSYFTVQVPLARKTYLSLVPVQYKGMNGCVVDPQEYSGSFKGMPTSYVQVVGVRGDTVVVNYVSDISGVPACANFGSTVYAPLSLLRKAIDREDKSHR
jgi:hypothetical protein